MNLFFGHLAYIVLLLATGLALPEIAWDPRAKEFMFILGGLAVWRYGWGLLNWARFHIYEYITFPRWRAEANALGDDGLPSHVFLLITSFRIGAETTRRVYKSVIEEAIAYDRPVTMVISIVERADEVFVKHIFAQYSPPKHIKMIFVRIAGTGKRDALACGFRTISKQMPAPNDVVAVIDGDSMLSKDLIRKCVPFFKMFPNMGALTTDEVCEVDGRPIFREWYNMRFAQRHIFMSSVSLSKHVLTLTGRMSMFRASMVTSSAFINQVELDWIDHWRLGRFKFLTGDDKTSWFHILKHGQQMLYIPDVDVKTIETPPYDSFLKSSVVLMRRWFGNMLRTNGRAILLGPLKMGWFTWFSIVDQRLSMWTALTGLGLALIATMAFTPYALLYYVWWMLFTRYVITLTLWSARPNVSAAYPFLLYYNQMVGSFIKTMVLFRLDKQKWTRQNTTLEGGSAPFGELLIKYSSSYLHILSLSVFACVLSLVSGAIELPDMTFWLSL